MDQDDFDNFEFIDYTTSGPWEKFIVQIEDSLKQWGLVHNNFGVFNPKVMPSSEHSNNLDQELALAINEERHISNVNDKSSTTTTTIQDNKIPTSPSKVFQHSAKITLEDVTYTLVYRYHPAKARIAAGIEQIDLDFLPTHLEGQDHHILHRWTALTHILVLSPASEAESTIIDLGTAKLLLSSFAIAFQNTGCNIPVFVPTGHARTKTYTGLSIQPQLSSSRDTFLGLEESAEDQAIEVRFNTVLVPYPPAQYTDLSGILDLFIERMGIEDENPNNVDGSEGYSHEVKERIFVSGLFSYHLESWYDEDWRRWFGPSEDESTASSSQEESFVRNVPTLPFGPAHDPLRSLQLVARFASAPSTVYLDSKNFTDMDASQANIWQLKARFGRSDYDILSGILEDVISSWELELPSRLSSGGFDSGSDEPRSYTSLLKKGARLIQGSIAMVDISDVENIVTKLFLAPSGDTAYRIATKPAQPKHHSRQQSGLSVERVISAAELGLHFRHATTVPYGSFLWNMVQHLIDVISPNSDINYATSFTGFLKTVWSELFIEFSSYWNNREMIPWIQVLGEFAENEQSDSVFEPSYDHGQLFDNGDVSNTPRIDLRFNLLHQKLSMINCCIFRDNLENKEKQDSTTTTSSVPNTSSTKSIPDPDSPPQSNASSVSSTVTSDSATEEKQQIESAIEEAKPEITEKNEGGEDDVREALVEATELLNIEKTSETEIPETSSNSESPEQTISEPDNNEPKAYKGLKLLETGKPLVIPTLQDPGYMTQDMIQQQEDLLEELGSSADAAKTRAEIQSAQLVSDMSAFKAANIGCVLGDFIRWYSPKDWDNEKQQMSARMADSGNFWQELWEKSVSLSAKEQKPLFDCSKQAEQALSYLRDLSVAQLSTLLVPTIFLIAYDTLASHPVSSVSPTVARSLQALARDLSDFPWDALSPDENELDLSPLLAHFRAVETIMGQFITLARKFPRQYSLVERVLGGAESVVEDGPERDCVYNQFVAGASQPSSFPKPIQREFVFETFDPSSSSSTPTSDSSSSPMYVSSGDLTGWHARPLQRRMYACFRDSEVRIVEAIAKDGMFM